jgi:EAL domain-containing protein (putative c-di-GMP-specific phosphodiesterase class I)
VIQIVLGATLGLETIAEGIEYAEQLERLRDLHCDQGQGFYLARPLERERLGELLSRRRAEWADSARP